MRQREAVNEGRVTGVDTDLRAEVQQQRVPVAKVVPSGDKRRQG